MIAVLNIQDYIDEMTAEGLYNEAHPVPELNSRIQTFYIELCRKELAGFHPDSAAIFKPQGLPGFWIDPLDPQPVLRLALNAPMPLPSQNITLEALSAGIGAQKTAIADASHGAAGILTETFAPQDDAADRHSHVILINSPVAIFDHGFESYLASLKKDRRKRARQLLTQLESGDLSVAVSSDKLTPEETVFAKNNLKAKWGDDFDYAWAQSIWAIAASELADTVYFGRCYAGGALRMIKTYIRKGHKLVGQSNFKDESAQYDGMGSLVDFCVIRHFADNQAAGITVLDPNCRNSLDDPFNIVMGKRAIVNRDDIKPLLAVPFNAGFQTSIPSYITPEDWAAALAGEKILFEGV